MTVDTPTKPTQRVIPKGMKQVTVTEYLINIQPDSNPLIKDQYFGGMEGNITIQRGVDVWAPAWVKERLDLAVEVLTDSDPSDINKRITTSTTRLPYSMKGTREVQKLVPIKSELDRKAPDEDKDE
jgi:hypothetical protein